MSTEQQQARARAQLEAAGWDLRSGISSSVIVAEKGEQKIYGSDAVRLARYVAGLERSLERRRKTHERPRRKRHATTAG